MWISIEIKVFSSSQLARSAAPRWLMEVFPVIRVTLTTNQCLLGMVSFPGSHHVWRVLSVILLQKPLFFVLSLHFCWGCGTHSAWHLAFPAGCAQLMTTVLTGYNFLFFLLVLTLFFLIAILLSLFLLEHRSLLSFCWFPFLERRGVIVWLNSLNEGSW